MFLRGSIEPDYQRQLVVDEPRLGITDTQLLLHRQGLQPDLGLANQTDRQKQGGSVNFVL